MPVSPRTARHGGVPVNHRRQVPRLKRIEGQIRGLQQMIESERDCIDVAHQIHAVVAALRRVEADMLGDHLQAITTAITQGKLSEAERRQLCEQMNALLAKK